MVEDKGAPAQVEVPECRAAPGDGFERVRQRNPAGLRGGVKRTGIARNFAEHYNFRAKAQKSIEIQHKYGIIS